MSSDRREQYDLQIANSAQSQEPSVVQDQHKWTVYQSSINLPALLNDPRLSKRETDFFTKTWGDAFENTLILPSPYLREITRSHFEKYLHKTSTVSPFFCEPVAFSAWHMAHSCIFSESFFLSARGVVDLESVYGQVTPVSTSIMVRMAI